MANQVAATPPVGGLFAAFLGDNPIESILGPTGVLKSLSSSNADALTGKTFFPQLIADPFHTGFVIVFIAAAVMSVIGATASFTAGGKYVHQEDEPAGDEPPHGTAATMSNVQIGTRQPDAKGRGTVDRLLTDSAGRLAFVIGQLTRRLRVVRGGLSHSLLSARVSVSKNGPLRLADLAQVELVSAPSITRLVAELEAKALVSRTPDPADGRTALIQVTDACLEAVQVARRVRQQIVTDLLEPLSLGEVATIEAALPSLEWMLELR